MRTLGDHPTSLYADGSTLLAWQDTVTGVQRFFMGHTASVVAVAFSGDGQLMATAQVRSECALSTHHSIQRCNALRIVTSGLARAHERWTNPKHSRRTCTCEYGLLSWGGESAGVAKQPRERSPTRSP
jgi:hypothetical protein